MKNVKISKKLLSMLTAGVLMATPVMANADNETENTNTNEFKLVQQTREITPMTTVEYTLGIQSSYEYLTKFINYDNMQGDLQCLYFLTNRAYMPKEVEEELLIEKI